MITPAPKSKLSLLSNGPLRDRLERQLQLTALAREEGVRQRVPYVAHLRLHTRAREMDVLLGETTRISPKLSLVDWRSAPLAEVFFTCEEGDEYEIPLEDRLVAGRVLEKNWVSFSDGQLVGVETPFAVVERGLGGNWNPGVRRGAPGVRPRDPAARKPFRSPLEVTLDAMQQRIVELPPDQSVLILGEAGFGKTTVGLHRLLALRRLRGSAFRGAVMVPTDGLRRLTQLMLDRRGAGDIEVWLYDRWASRLAHRVFRDLPRQESANASPAVIRLKRHAALREVLPEFVQSRPQKPGRRRDLEHLFGDRECMARVVALARGTLGQRAVGEVLEHTRIQFRDRAEVELSHVDADRLATVDGRRLDDGTPTEDANTVDAEDYAVLFELERLGAIARRSRPAEVSTYDCILVDEAQEFAPLERVLIGRGLKARGTLIVAGDAAQQLDPSTDFVSWRSTLEDLGAPNHQQVALEVSYRCPAEVTALARSLLSADPPVLGPETSIVRASHQSALHLMAWLAVELQNLATADPTASIAVVLRSAALARFHARILGHSVSVRLALDGDFDFQPGIVVTCVAEVKGLEFDYVLIPDADAGTYPATPEARRNLYVAVTRATHRLVLAASGAFSPLLLPTP